MRLNLRLWAWTVLILGIVWCRIWFVEDVVYNIDEAEYATAADALSHHWLAGVDLLGTTKPPGIVLLFKALFLIFGRSMAVIHVAHISLLVLAGMLVVEMGIGLWGQAAAIPAAVLFWIISGSYAVPQETIALNVETPGMLFMALAFVLALRRQTSWGMLAAGMALGCAALFRQSFAAFWIPLALLIWWERKRIQHILWAAFGVILPWLPVFFFYRYNLAQAWDSWVIYPLEYASDLGWSGFLQAAYMTGSEFVLQTPITVAMMIGGLILLWKKRSELTSKFLLAFFIVSLLALCSGSRFFGHYWIQLYPAIALTGVPAWRALAEKKSLRMLLGGAIVLGSLIAALHFPFWRTWDANAPQRGEQYFRLGHEELEIACGNYARERTRPDETIAVWGYCPQIYWFAQRLPGVRDYLCHFVTGYSPGAFDPFRQLPPRSKGRPNAQMMFVQDMEQRKPAYIFDLVQVDDYEFSFENFSLRNYPLIADYVRQNYLPEGTVGRVPVYRRRTAQDTWWPTESKPQ
jgi:hypothetical protein